MIPTDTDENCKNLMTLQRLIRDFSTINIAVVLALLLWLQAAPAALCDEERKEIRFLFPEPWAVIREWDAEVTRIRVDATDFRSVWIDSGCMLSLISDGSATQTEGINASFHIGKPGPGRYGPHKLGAMVTSYNGEVLAKATVIYIYAPPELGHDVPVPTPIKLERRLPSPTAAREGSTAASPVCKQHGQRRLVRSLLQNSRLDCVSRARLVEGHGQDGVIIDVGSHDGQELAALAAVARKVIAFEATPSKAAAIERRLKEQGIWHKVDLHAAAATNVRGPVSLYTPHGANGSEMDSLGSTYYYTGNVRHMNVSGVRIDDLVQEPVMLLKVDTQGHELQVLQGAERLLSHYGVELLVLEFAPKLLMANGVDPALLLHYLYDMGYQCLTCPGDDDQQRPPASNWFRDLDFFDLGFLPNYLSDGTEPKFDPGRFCDLLCF